MSSFGGIQTALSGLLAQQYGLETTSNNVSNANTPGYHRQEVDLVEGIPYPTPGLTDAGPGQIGSGVLVGSINRMIDQLAVTSLRSQLSQQGAANVQQDATSQVQGVFNDLSNNGIGNLLDQFWSAWHDVSNAPTDLGVRGALISKAQTLASTVQQTYSQLSNQQKGLDQQVGQDVTTLNSLATQVAALNQQIVQVQASGQQPNDLLDQRDQLLNQISSLAQINVNQEANGAVQVVIGNVALVDGGNTTTLTTSQNSSGWTQIQAPDGTVIQPGSGAISQLEYQRDTQIPQWMSQLDDFASRLITAVNDVHEGINATTGATTSVYDLATPGTPVQRAFFSGTGAADIAVNSDIVGNPQLIAASQTANGSGDGSNALAIADLQNDPTAGGQPSTSPTLDGQYQELAIGVGNAASAGQAASDDQNLLVQHLQQRDSQVGSVSLDEEGANMETYQRAYEASARALTAFDSMLDTLINKTGMVGR